MGSAIVLDNTVPRSGPCKDSSGCGRISGASQRFFEIRCLTSCLSAERARPHYAHSLTSNQVLMANKADTVASKQFEVARNRYIIGKITNDALYLAQGEKDAAVLAYVQALRNYWTAYYHLRRVTLYDFVTRQEMADTP